MDFSAGVIQEMSVDSLLLLSTVRHGVGIHCSHSQSRQITALGLCQKANYKLQSYFSILQQVFHTQNIVGEAEEEFI